MSSFADRLRPVEGMDDGGVVSPAKGIADFDQLQRQQFTAEQHGDLTRHRQHLGAGLRLEPFGRDAPFLGHGGLNGGDTVIPTGAT